MTHEANKNAQEAVNDFNGSLIFLVNSLFNKNKNDGDVLRMKEQLAIAQRESAVLVIEKLGPYIYDHGELIQNNRVDALLNKDYSSAVQNACLQDDKNINYGMNLISVCKKTWNTFSKSEQIVLWNHLQKMFKSYCSYLFALRTASRATLK